MIRKSQSGFLRSGRALGMVILVSAMAMLLNLRETGSLWPGMGPADVVRTLQQVDMMVLPDCDPALVVCTLIAENMVARVQMGPGVVPMRPFDMVLTVEGVPQVIDDVTVEFSMSDMEMGLNRYRLKQEEQTGRWLVSAILPVCTRQRADWQARVEIVVQDTLYVALLPFHTQ